MKFKRLLAIALSVTVMFTIGAASGVFAAGQNSSEQHPSSAAGEANLVKYLQMPEGLNDPGETFTFTFTPAAPDQGKTYGVAASEFTATSTTIASSGMTAVTTGDAADTGNRVGTKTIASIFEGYNFPHAGEYKFTVAETAGSNTDITYASDTYTLRLVVDKDKHIDDVTVQKGENGDKVDPTDVNPEDNPGGATPSDSKGGFTFTNSYTKNVENHKEPVNPNPDPDPQNPDNPTPIDPSNPKTEAGAFVLDKFVLGEYGDQTKDFVFTVKVTLPKLNKDFQFTGANAPTVTANKGSISGTWADGANVTVNLKHEGQLNFPTLPVGTKITVSEAAVDGYTQVLTTSAAENATTITVTEDAGGYAIMRNSFHDENVTPTGIIINNLPYILLILLAVGGIVLFARKRRYQ